VSRFALVVPFPELAPAVDELRERTCLSKPSHGMPPHVTLLVPSPPDARTLGEELRAFEPFDVTFARVDRFPGTAWLAPEPAEPFVAMVGALVARFPSFRPDDGRFADVVPHLTVAQAEFDVAVPELEASLPLHARVERALLLEHASDERWAEAASLPLGGV
jgi:hypothetical protein